MEYYRGLFDDCSRLMLRIQSLPQPVIARVHGIATAAGCQLVAMCDLAVAANDARFAVSGINVGLFCATPSVALSRNVGRKAAFEMLVTGEFIDAPTALRADSSIAACRPNVSIRRSSAGEVIAAKPRSAWRPARRCSIDSWSADIATAYRLAGEAMACNMIDEIAQEGVTAFIEKRSPNWDAD